MIVSVRSQLFSNLRAYSCYYRVISVLRQSDIGQQTHHTNVFTNTSNLLRESFLKRCDSLKLCRRLFSNVDTNSSFDLNEYSSVADETLESLSDKFEDILENQQIVADPDVCLNNGVLTVSLGKAGTYVINKQTPNRQIWLSSPKSGPKRYDYVNGHWVYKHDNVSLHSLLNKELSEILDKNIDFTDCDYGKQK
ncbi:uncharacterized protein B4U80_05011 [Leptotrombidium deliense]|uniref:ferroxidase n=1 Tax=Leptotrombidium deliense TaxID=299467 RepID=A0A443S0Z1_9ACAR|nr:uncharacterized protein B4U80_05011 [Leptotrombidium deliense]